MRPRTHLWLFPAPWRKRYGDEVAQLLEDIEHEDGRVRAMDRLDVASAGAAVRAGAWRRSISRARRHVTTRTLLGAMGAAIVVTAVSAAAVAGTAGTPASGPGSSTPTRSKVHHASAPVPPAAATTSTAQAEETAAAQSAAQAARQAAPGG